MLKERIEILHGANLINDELADFAYRVIEILNNHPFDDELAGMFITHLAMASQRVIDHAELNDLDEAIWNQVKESAGYPQANELMKQIIELAPIEYPNSEKQFIIMHLSNMFQN